jgi:hypothetical protein
MAVAHHRAGGTRRGDRHQPRRASGGESGTAGRTGQPVGSRSLRGLLTMAEDWDNPAVNDTIADDFGSDR